MISTKEMIPWRYGETRVRDKLLTDLYMRAGKHAGYQTIPEELAAFMDMDGLDIHSRYERERWDYITKKIGIEEKKCLDIGGNTGFFSLKCLGAGAVSVDYYEGNENHAAFVKRAGTLLGYEDRLHIHPSYYDFERDNGKKYDLALLMNVLHHVGSDYGDCKGTDEAREIIALQLRAMQGRAEYIVFQMGYNLWGDRNRCLFEYGTKREMIDFVTGVCDGVYDVVAVGIAERFGDGIEYNEPDDDNIERDDSMGEFLNRPIFILKGIDKT